MGEEVATPDVSVNPAPPGAVVWFTGLPGAGKTTVARLVRPLLELQGAVVDHLDGDEVRARLLPELGFTPADRRANVSRVAWVASRIARAGGIVLVSLISPYRRRSLARSRSSLESPRRTNLR